MTTIVVQRKSVVPFATLTILAALATVLARFNPLGYVIDVSWAQAVVPPIAFCFGFLFAAITLLRALFVNVTVRSIQGLFTVHLVPVRSGKRLARSFSEIFAGEIQTIG